MHKRYFMRIPSSLHFGAKIFRYVLVCVYSTFMFPYNLKRCLVSRVLLLRDLIHSYRLEVLMKGKSLPFVNHPKLIISLLLKVPCKTPPNRYYWITRLQVQANYAVEWFVLIKVHTFWQGHKNLQNLHLTFDRHYIRQK